MALHIFNTPHIHQIQKCIEEHSTEDAIVLIEEAATKILCSDWAPAITTEAPKLFVLSTNTSADGKCSDSEIVEQKSALNIDFSEFVELTSRHNPIISW